METTLEYDVIVVGTGLVESILAAALARAGKRILYVDNAKWYGAEHATLSLSEFVSMVNNNFTNDVAPVPVKSVRLALNIQTFINLVGYGYENVRELGEAVDFNDPKVRWVKG